MIFIIGYMGAGKSIIGKKLSEDLKLPFVDSDTKISNDEKKSIKEIFNEYGEAYFRDKEKKFLDNIKGNKVISCGGGMPIYNNNIKKITSKGISIYLKNSYINIYNRLNNERENRPLINLLNNQELKKFIKKGINERESIYNKAKYIINAENKSKEKILREIHSLIITS